MDDNDKGPDVGSTQPLALRFYAMLVLQNYAKEVRQRCLKIYDLLLASARPILAHGNEEEVSQLKICLRY